MTTVVFTRVGPHHVADLHATATTSAELTEAVHHHARAILASRSVGVTLDGDHGQIRLGRSTVGEFTVHDQAPPPEPPGPRDPMHGYSLNDLDRFTRQLLHRNRWSGADTQDRYDAIWHALAECLLAAATPPTRGDLLHAGLNARSEYVRNEMRTHGNSTHAPGERMPRFEAYWTVLRAPSPEARVVDREALHQIWPRLTLRQQEALTALAATGDYAKGAQMLGITLGTFNVTVSKARRRFLLWWHEGEEPSHLWRMDKRRDPDAKTSRAVTAPSRRTGPRKIHELVHGRASTYANHGCRCDPCKDAATEQARAYGRSKGAVERRRMTVSQLADVRARRAAGESVKALAKEFGFEDTYLYRLLNGTRSPAPDPAEELAA